MGIFKVNIASMFRSLEEGGAMKLNPASTARLAVTAGLCASMVLGSTPVAAIADELDLANGAQGTVVVGGGAPAGATQSKSIDATSSPTDELNVTSGDEDPLTGNIAEAPKVDGPSPAPTSEPEPTVKPASANAKRTTSGVVTTVDDLATALEAGGAVKLDASITVNDGRTFKISKDITLDLNGFVLKSEHTGSNHRLFSIANAAFTVKDGSASRKGGIQSATGGILMKTGAKVKIESGSIRTQNVAVDSDSSGISDASLTVTGGTISTAKDNGAVILRGGTGIVFNMSGGVIESTGNNNTVYLRSHSAKDAIVANFTGGTIKREGTGGQVVTVYGTVFNMSGGAVIESQGVAGISLGEDSTTTGILNMSGSAHIQTAGACVKTRGTSTVNIKGGTLASKNGAVISHLKTETPVVNIEDGTFTENAKPANIKDYLKPGFALDSNGSVMPSTDNKTDVYVDGKFVAGYATLAEAVEKAPAGATITLRADLTESVTVGQGRDLTIDLASHTLTAKSGKAIKVDGGCLALTDSTAKNAPVISDDYNTVTYLSGKVVANDAAIAVHNGGTFVLDGGTVESTGDCGVYTGAENGGSGSFTMRGGYIVAQEYGIGVMNAGSTVSVEGGVVVAKDNAALAGNGSKGYGGTTVNVSGGTLIGHIKTSGYIACGIYHPQSGTLNITGGTIYADGGVGVLARAGSANITGGSITSTGKASGRVGDNETQVPSAGIVVDRAAGYPGAAESDVVKVSGSATIKASDGSDAISALVAEGASKKGLIQVTGGSFSTTPADEFIVEGCGPTKQPDGSYVVHKHSLKYHAATDSTCTTHGNHEYWSCEVDGCGALFTDAAGTNETTADVLRRPLAAHSLERIDAVPATQDKGGVLEHWKCSVCGGLFLDKEGLKPTTADDLRVPATGKSEVQEVTITFHDGIGGTAKVTVKCGELLAEPKAPSKDGWKFVGWFKTIDDQGRVYDEWDFSKDVASEDMTLYGGWVKQSAQKPSKDNAKPTNKLPATSDMAMLPIAVVGSAGVAAIALASDKRRKSE